MARNPVNSLFFVIKLSVILTIQSTESTFTGAYTTYSEPTVVSSDASQRYTDYTSPTDPSSSLPSETFSSTPFTPPTTWPTPSQSVSTSPLVTTAQDSTPQASLSTELTSTATQDIFDTFPTDPKSGVSSATRGSEQLSSSLTPAVPASKTSPISNAPITPKVTPVRSTTTTTTANNIFSTRSTLMSPKTTPNVRTPTTPRANSTLPTPKTSSTSTHSAPTRPKTTSKQSTTSIPKTTSTTKPKHTLTYPTPPTLPPLPPLPRFCNKTASEEYETPCRPCNSPKMRNPCKPGEHRAMDFVGRCMLRAPKRWRRGKRKRRRVKRRGCTAKCLRTMNIPACCTGFWGDNCDECPGGARDPCNGNGICWEDGTCACNPGFNGTACEVCVDSSKYGPKCKLDCGCKHGECVNYVKGGGACICHSGYKGEKCQQHINGCEKLNCASPGTCAETDKGATCVCPPGYDLNENGVTCDAVNPCLGEYPHCGSGNSECKKTEQGLYKCVCAENYTGDGIVCLPIDPCQTNRGGCPDNKDCKFTGPNRHECVCMSGYKLSDEGDNCTLVDICTPSTCHSKAICETTEPNTATCTCIDDYIGNGTVCYGNIIERLKELDANSKALRNNLEYAIHYLSKYYMEELTQHGPFTIFVPTDRAFKGVKRASGNFGKFLEDKDRALQIMRQHILIGKYRLEDLQIYNKFYTLQGNPAMLQVKVSKDVFKYKLDGTRGKGKVKVRNLEAANGMIHVVNNLLTTEPEIEGDPQGTALDLMQQNTRHYETTVKMIKIVGLEDMFSMMNVTVFGVVDDVWRTLPKGTIEYLSEDPDGQVKLKDILLNHIAPGTVGITHLINMDSILTMDNYNVTINVTNLGQVRLDEKASITQANIIVKNGFVHRVDGLIVPSYIDVIYPNFCFTTASLRVLGRCVPCKYKICPRPTDLQVSLIGCGSRGAQNAMCRSVCKRERKIRDCCPGFYGASCLPCPNGFRAPCSGRGQCDENILGSGKCKCEDGFAGSACENCRDENKFGPACNNTCTCLNGICNNGPEGDGLCRKNTCTGGFFSENCDREMVPCGPRVLFCHAHSHCYTGSDSIYRCKCDPGYEGDGENCIEMDPCEQKPNGGCHQQAQCIKVNPLKLRCECNKGWVGDGEFCSPKSPCYHGCHENATCTVLKHEYHCVCNAGFKGNGTWCETDNVCLEDNGGCHPKAFCTPLRPGLASGERRTCACPFNMSGNGTVCYGTIAEQLMAHPNLTKLAEIMASVPKDELLLSQDGEDFTFFAPTDAAIEEFMESIFIGYRQWDFAFVINFLNFHTLYKAYSLEDLKLYDGIVRGYPTLYDGFNLFTVNTKKGLKIVVNHSKFANFVVTESNRPTTNGIYHVVDKVLEAFLPDNNVLPIEEALKSNPDYSIFFSLLKDTKVLDELNVMDEFTVFVPTNDAFAPINQHLSANALRYYVVSSLIFTPSVYEGQRMDTLLGPRHQLEVNLQHDSVLVNNVELSKPDVLIEGGVIHQISEQLHPVLNWCNASDITIDNGPCTDCNLNISDLQCPQGFSPFVPARVLHLQCVYKDTVGGSLNPGCNQICGKAPSEATCCAGYFGSHCQECPGGAEVPCNANGVCLDSISGNGTCDCDPGFTGVDCSQCEDRSMALPHCNTTHPDCESERSGCHENAVCKVMLQGPAHCTCMTGYHGDGQQCEMNVDPCQAEDKGGCDGSRASCHYTPPSVTELQDNAAVCQCLQGYGGNGTLCTKNMLDLVSRLPELRYFRAKLDQVEDVNVTDLMGNGKRDTTLFAPMSENYVSLQLSDLVIQGEIFSLPSDPSNKKTDSVKRESNSFSQRNLINTVTALGGQEINITVDEAGRVFANNVPILKKNIATLNGLLHITETPISSFTPLGAKPAQVKGKSDSTLIAVCVVIVLLIVIVVILIIAFLYKRYKNHGGFKIFNRSKSSDSSDTSVSFARLNALDVDEDDGESYKGSEGPKYDNPIFDDPDLM